ncbi:glycosyltransferase family 2 protein [Pedobacter terrae]|uniref:glycosyltransferase family 2 protein n=1 Tax=Pedobacter terrae TaxID=405671 RepID=UPI002FF4A9CA
MSEQKISIITVNYNNRTGLEKTMSSVFSQSATNIEFIVIDGGSNDGSVKLLNQNADKITYWISESDRGIYHAMNKGIKIATGDYILFLNSGDWLHSDTVIAQSLTSMNEQLDIYYGDIIYDEIHQQNKRAFPDQLNFAFFFEQNISHQASFIKKSLFKTIFLYNENFKIVSDWEFFTYAICKREASYKHLDIIITNYDATGISSNTDNHLLMNSERETSLNIHFPEFIADYNYFKQLRDKKTEQFLYIKQYPIAYKCLKAIINLILLFLPKFKKSS